MSMRYFERVHTLVGWEPGRWKDIQLSARTIVVGPNGSGKSRLGTSLSLLVSGRAPGEVFGREGAVALAADLEELFPAGNREVHGIDQNGNRIDPPAAASHASDWSHPIRAVSSALRGSQETASAFFAPFMIGETLDIAGKIPEALKQTAIGWKITIPTTVVELRSAIDAAKVTVRTLVKKIEGAEAVLVQVPATDATVSRSLELEALVGTLERQSAQFGTIQVRAKAWTQWCAQRDRVTHEEQRLGAPPQVPDFAGQITQLQTYREDGQKQLDGLLVTLEQGEQWATSARDTFERDVAGNLDAVAKRSHANENDPGLVYANELVRLASVAPDGSGCPGCGASHMGDRRTWAARAQAFRDGEITRTQAVRDQTFLEMTALQATADQRRVELEAHIETSLKPYKNKIQVCQTELARVDAELARLQREAEGVRGVFDAYNAQRLKLEQDKVWFSRQPIPEEVHEEEGSVTKLQEVQASLRQAREQYNMELKRQGAAEQITNARKTIAEAQAQRGWFAGWLESLQQIHGWLVADGVGSFQQRVQAYLPPEFQFRILLERETGAGIFRFGLVGADGTVHSITYGASRALILYALACACLDLLPTSERPPAPILLLDEERSIDPKHLVKLMLALGSTPYQVVVTSTHFPAEIIEGWTVVDLSTLQDDGVPVVSTKATKKGKGGRKKKEDVGSQHQELVIGTPISSMPLAPVSEEDLDVLLPDLPELV